jgi:putative addiction module component (TIGR02574 family)
MQQGIEMSDEAKRLIKRARALPPQERIALIEELFDSLGPVDPSINETWIGEAGRRLAAYRRGEVTAKDLRDIVAKYRS